MRLEQVLTSAVCNAVQQLCLAWCERVHLHGLPQRHVCVTFQLLCEHQHRMQFARGWHDGEDYAIKFFTVREAFEREDALYSNAVLRDMMPAVKLIEANADGGLRSASGWPFPPCIVIERGESLDKWAERLRPDFPTILQVCRPFVVPIGSVGELDEAGRHELAMCLLHLRSCTAGLRICGDTGCPWHGTCSTQPLSISAMLQVLMHVTTRLQRLHEAGMVHRDIKPGKVLPPCIS
jgi:serine/threonine protein kinase